MMQHILKLKSTLYRNIGKMGLVSTTDVSESDGASAFPSVEENLRKFSAQHEWDPNLPGMYCTPQKCLCKDGSTYIRV